MTTLDPSIFSEYVPTADGKGYQARVLADSISATGERLITFEAKFPRIILAEKNTHKMISKNSASTRAIPIETQIQKVLDDPAMPVEWGRNQAGMSAKKLLSPDEEEQAKATWLAARDDAIAHVRRLQAIGEIQPDGKQGVHKQLAGRLLEPWLWQTAILTGTDWDNYFALRCDENAQPEIRRSAVLLRDLYNHYQPKLLSADEWHLPLVYDEDVIAAREQYPDDPQGALLKVSTGRCARVSYLTHDNKRDLAADIRLHDMLISSGHMSPCEHVARPFNEHENAHVAYIQNAILDDEQFVAPSGSDPRESFFYRQAGYAGNLRGWVQYRKQLPFEYNFGAVLEQQA